MLLDLSPASLKKRYKLSKTRTTKLKLLELMKLPTSRQGIAWLGSPLCSTIEGYMRDVQNKAWSVSLGIKCLLKECPRFVNSFFIELGIDFN